jgi:rSAM/selenodomain-associated transferase 2
MKLSVIIPTFNEERCLPKTLEVFRDGRCQAIVVDGGSADDTCRIAREHGCEVLLSSKSRGRQQRVGASHACGDTLVFVHADTILPEGYEGLIEAALSERKAAFGAFRLCIDPPSTGHRLIAGWANARSRLFRLPYGDQAIFVRRSRYYQAGGFPDWPIMEDVGLVERLRKLGTFKLVNEPVRTSARRWEKEHAVYTTVRNWSLFLRYKGGVSPHVLARHYSDKR